jgi:acetylornithine deacetylase/succinyl-diaminopimelate desuccinylase-like protein
MDQAAELLADWCRAQPIKGMAVEIVRLEGRTPVLFIEVAGQNEDTVLLYGHLDKQPEFTGWSEGLSTLGAGDPRRQALWPRRRR